MDRKKIARRLARIAVALASGTSMRNADVLTPAKLEEWARLQQTIPNTDQGNKILIDIMRVFLDDVRKMKHNNELYSKVEDKAKKLFSEIKNHISKSTPLKGEAKDFYTYLSTNDRTVLDIFDYVCALLRRQSTDRLNGKNVPNGEAGKKAKAYAKEIIELYNQRSILFEQYIRFKIESYSDLIRDKTSDVSGGVVPFKTKGRNSEIFNIRNYYLNFKKYAVWLKQMHVKKGDKTTDPDKPNPYQQSLDYLSGDTDTVKKGLDQIDQLTLEMQSSAQASILNSSPLNGKNLLFGILSNTTVSIGNTGTNFSIGNNFNQLKSDTPMDVLFSFFVARMMPDTTKEKEFIELDNEECKKMLESLGLEMYVAISQASQQKGKALDDLKELAKASSQKWLTVVKDVKKLEKGDFRSLIGVIQETNGIAIAYDSAIKQSAMKCIELTKKCKQYCDEIRKKLGLQSNGDGSKKQDRNKKSSITAGVAGDDLDALFTGLEKCLSDLCAWCVELSNIILEYKNKLTESVNSLVAKIDAHAKSVQDEFAQVNAVLSESTSILKDIKDECESIISESNENVEPGVRQFGSPDFGVVDNTVDDYDVAASEDDDDL